MVHYLNINQTINQNAYLSIESLLIKSFKTNVIL